MYHCDSGQREREMYFIIKLKDLLYCGILRIMMMMVMMTIMKTVKIMIILIIILLR